jgi:hypothetical protein
VLTCSETAPVWRVGGVGAGWRLGGPSTGFRSTSVIVGRADTLVSFARQHLPDVHGPLLQAVPLLGTEAEATALRRAYTLLPRQDLVAAMLAAPDADLAVAEPAGAAWSAASEPVAAAR